MRRIIDRLVAIDCALFDRVSKSQTPVLDAVLPKLTLAANNSAIWVVASGLLTALGGRRGKRAALRGMGSIGITSLFVNQVVKRMVRRPRPSLRRGPRPPPPPPPPPAEAVPPGAGGGGRP